MILGDLNLLVLNHCLGFRVPRRFLHNWVSKVMELLRGHDLVKKSVLKKTIDKQLIVVFVDQEQSRRLNFEFRSKDKSTDVLSFAPIEEGSFGELVLCVPVLKKQAKEHRLSLRDEAAYLVLHGILHLLGYGHEVSEKDAQVMFKIQDDIFAQLSRDES